MSSLRPDTTRCCSTGDSLPGNSSACVSGNARPQPGTGNQAPIPSWQLLWEGWGQLDQARLGQVLGVWREAALGHTCRGLLFLHYVQNPPLQFPASGSGGKGARRDRVNKSTCTHPSPQQLDLLALTLQTDGCPHPQALTPKHWGSPVNAVPRKGQSQRGQDRVSLKSLISPAPSGMADVNQL